MPDKGLGFGLFAKTKNMAQQHNWVFVQQENGQLSDWQSLRNQIYLGDDEFELEMQGKLDLNNRWTTSQRNKSKRQSNN